MCKGPYLDLSSTLRHQTWSNDPTQRDLLCGGFLLSIGSLPDLKMAYRTCKD